MFSWLIICMWFPGNACWFSQHVLTNIPEKSHMMLISKQSPGTGTGMACGCLSDDEGLVVLIVLKSRLKAVLLSWTSLYPYCYDAAGPHVLLQNSRHPTFSGWVMSHGYRETLFWTLQHVNCCGSVFFCRKSVFRSYLTGFPLNFTHTMQCMPALDIQFKLNSHKETKVFFNWSSCHCGC